MSTAPREPHLFWAELPEQRADGWRSAAAARAMRAELQRLRAFAVGELGLETPGRWAKTATGAPLPEQGWGWSASHARGRVALALLPGAAVGLDLEPLDRPRPRHAAQRLVELGAAPEALESAAGLFAHWTAAEAVLKLHGVGLGGLQRLRFEPADGHPRLRFDGQLQSTVQLLRDGLVFSIACPPRPDPAVPPAPPAPPGLPASPCLRLHPPQATPVTSP